MTDVTLKIDGDNVRLEGDVEQVVRESEAPKPAAGGGAPPTPITEGKPLKTREICWPCILLGVGTILVGIGYLWLLATEE